MLGRRRALVAVVMALATAAVGCGPTTTPRSAPPAGVVPLGHDPGPPASAWPAAIHDSRHSSAVAAGVVGPQTGTLRWDRDLGANVTPGPALAADGTVYVATNAGTLHALDPLTGADRWTLDGGGRYGSDLSTTPAVLDDGTILWPGPVNTLFAVDPGGHLLWRQAFAGFVLSPAARGDGRVYVMDMAGALTALDVSPSGHDVAWTVHLGATSYGSPAIGPDGSVVTTVDNQVVAVTDTGATGVVRWRWRAPATIEVSPAIASDGTVVVGPNDDYVYGIGVDGVLRWRWRKGDWSYSSAAVTPGGVAYLGDHLGFLDVLKASTGTLVRRFATIPKTEPHPGGVGVWTAPAIDARGDVYFGTVVGHVYGFDPGGRQLFDLDAGATVDSYPALGADGTLFVGSTSGRFYALADASRRPVPTVDNR